MQAAERSFVAEVRDGPLALDFTPVQGEAVLSGIAVRPAGSVK